MNKQGHIIILRPGISFEKYLSGFHEKLQKYLDRLRGILYFIQPGNYRGTGRGDFYAWPFSIDKTGGLQDFSDLDPPGTIQQNIEAKKLLAVYENKNLSVGDNAVALHSLDEAQKVFALMEDKDDYEIIEVRENEATINERTIGFDVGYLGGDFFSAIADTAIKPTWYPPDFDDMDDVTEQLKKLNDACLFNSLEDAETYRRLYLSKRWGDKQSFEGQTTIIQVRAAV